MKAKWRTGEAAKNNFFRDEGSNSSLIFQSKKLFFFHFVSSPLRPSLDFPIVAFHALAIFGKCGTMGSQFEEYRPVLPDGLN